MATPSMVNPCEEYLCCSSISQGISSLHGSHQVAQKFTRTTFPFRLSSGTSDPVKDLKVTAGSGPIGAKESEPLSRLLPSDPHPPTTNTIAKHTAATYLRVLFIEPIHLSLAVSLQRKSIQETELARQPGEAVHKNQPTNREQQHATENLDGVQVATEAFIEFQKSTDPECGNQKWNRQAC